MENKDRSRPLVYICSRYSGDTEENAEKAREYSRFAADSGAVPLTPHLFLPQFINEETERQMALELDRDLLKRCDEMWVFGIEDGVSDGMSFEILNAGEEGIDIRYFSAKCKEVLM